MLKCNYNSINQMEKQNKKDNLANSVNQIKTHTGRECRKYRFSFGRKYEFHGWPNNNTADERLSNISTEMWI